MSLRPASESSLSILTRGCSSYLPWVMTLLICNASMKSLTKSGHMTFNKVIQAHVISFNMIMKYIEVYSYSHCHSCLNVSVYVANLAVTYHLILTWSHCQIHG